MNIFKKFFIAFIIAVLMLPFYGQAQEQDTAAPPPDLPVMGPQQPPQSIQGPAQPPAPPSAPSTAQQPVLPAPLTPVPPQSQPTRPVQTQTQPFPPAPTPTQPPVSPAAPAAPPQVPPGTQLTPEQIKNFFAKPREENYIILNFDNAALMDVINTVSSITKENFIISPGLDAKITIHSSGRIPSSEIMSVFESILEVNNMTLVRSGQFYKIVAGAVVKQKPIEVKKGKDSEAVLPEDKPITQIIPVEYVPVGELTALFQPMISQFGSIVPNPRNNLLIINDMSSNIKRILLILKEVDIDAFQNSRMFFYQPQYSDVKTLSDDLTAIINALNLGREGGILALPIERINSLIIFSSSTSMLETIKQWIQKLDEDIATGQNIFVYPVQNVKAETIANILKTVYLGEAGAAPKTTTPARTVTQPGQPPQRPQIGQPVSAAKAEGTKVEIVTFEPTNSLVILAPPGIYRDIVETVKKLDVYPQEVLIEVMIAEVTLDKTEQFGVQWSALKSVQIEGKDFTGIGQGTSGQVGIPKLPFGLNAPDNPLSATATNLNASGLSFLLFKPDKLLALLHALASSGRVDILSSPRLLVRNQEEASIDVGSEIPTATSSTANVATTTVNTGTLTQNIEYKTIGIKLKIKPTINSEKTVVLDLEQEVSDQLSNVTVGQFSYPSFSTRKTKTSIVVPDEQGIVIGGIMKEKKDKNYQGIPLLSAIPLLGNLFRYTVDTKSKTELIVLLTPHVITNKNEADMLTMEFLEKLKEVKDYLKKNGGQINIPAGEEKK